MGHLLHFNCMHYDLSFWTVVSSFSCCMDSCNLLQFKFITIVVWVIYVAVSLLLYNNYVQQLFSYFDILFEVNLFYFVFCLASIIKI